ncbi:MAG: Rne/Rng family ribonuclease [Elusimicrobia bacterium]|nr:Rne/Rng family ribonuclease [Elusimicrobiota bacterium]
MSNENDPIPTQTQNPAPAEKPAPKLQRVFDAPPPAEPSPAPAPEPAAPQAAAPSTPSRREEQYPRADGPVEADRDVPQPEERRHDDASSGDDDGNDDHNDDAADDDGDDEGTIETAAPAPAPNGATPVTDAPTPGTPGAAPQQGQAGRQGQPGQGDGSGRRRRRRRRGRGGRGGEGAQGQQGQPNPQGPAPQNRPAPAEGAAPSPEAAPAAEKPQAPRRDERGGQRGERGERGDRGGRDQNRGGDRGGRGRDQNREHGRDQNRGDRGERGGRRDERREERGQHGHGQERTNEGRNRPVVKREVLANTSFEETRIAILENGRLSELHWERKSSQNIVGNIYKGTVENVLPGISSAFVNIGFDKNAYLYISDVLGEKNAAIDSTLKKGQQIMVQVAKEAISTKGPKVTMDVTLPGRYLVFTPFQSYVGISKHIAEPEERQRLEKIMDRMVAEHLGGKGLVVRTEAEGASEEELEREVKYLLAAWQQIQKKFDETPPPTLLHQDLSLALQIARDIMSDQVYVYMLDNKAAHKEVVDFVDGFAPELKERVRLYESKTPIFKAFNIEGEIAHIRETKVALPNGGSIVIQEAESLCAIDVNTGRFTGSKSQEETVTQTNIEAAQLVAQQLRLRNIGGIIVVDFIDMRKASNRQKVMEAFADACRGDRAKIRILPITRLGLIELTRERKRMSTAALLSTECPQCTGSGRVLSSETLRIKIQREIFEMTGGRPGGSIRVMLHPHVAEAFRTQHTIIEKNVQRSVKIQTDPQLMWEDYKIILE